MKLHGPLIPTLSLAAGIAASYIAGMQWWIGVFPIVVAIGLYLYILYSSSNPIAAFKVGKLHIVWVILLFLGIGLIDESLNRPLSIDESFGGERPDFVACEVSGVLSKTYGDRIEVEILGTNGAKARIRSGVTDLAPGDIIRIPSKSLIEISKDTTEIGQKIAPMMKAKGFLYSGRIYPKYIEHIGVSQSPLYLFINIREKIESNIENSHLAKPTCNFINAILMGDKTGIDENTRLTFASGGTAHMLALSGLHLGILAGFLLFLLIPIKYTGKYKVGYILAIVLLWLYVLLTGMSYSSVRACIMLTLAFSAIILERRNYAGNALCSSILLILLFDPLALFDAGFQLSVVCVGALILFSPPLNPIDQRRHHLLFEICGAIITTIVATAASWVLTSYYFSQIPLMFLPANLLLLPLLPSYLAAAFIFVLLLCCGVEFHLLGRFLDYGYNFLIWATEKLSNGTEFVVDYQISIWGVATWLLALVVAACYLNRKQILE
ncbi:MAG: ComEC/Rec2 family competence protein [Muribaculaceae bacterium]|nr:ComEC/Rec2 family competence protein [Muribaculaceae bacterium]